MENSPLRFLDYDMSLMLAKKVRISQEEEARKFHSNNYKECLVGESDLNQDNHYFLSSVFDTIYSEIGDNPLDFPNDYRWARGRTWFELSIHERQRIFEEERSEEEDCQACMDYSWRQYLHYQS